MLGVHKESPGCRDGVVSLDVRVARLARRHDPRPGNA